jgi:drug/metabolite transporter (DMT)-like permease
MMAALGVAILSCMDATMKEVSAAYPIGQVVGLRYTSGAAFALLAFVVLGGPRPTIAAVKRNLVRAIVMLLTAVTFFTAIARLPLAVAIALTFMAPLLMALLGRLILKEPIAPRALGAIAIGFLGVVVIARGQQVSQAQSFDALGISAALACAFFYALSLVLMRKQSAKDSALTIVTLSNILALILMAPIVAVQWQPPTLGHLGAFTLAGLLGTCGHLCMAWAYSRAHAGKLGIVEYTAFLWGALLGYAFFAEVPTVWTFGGAAMIILACLLTAFTRPRPAPTTTRNEGEPSLPAA